MPKKKCHTCSHWDQGHCTNAAHAEGPFKEYLDALRLKIGNIEALTTGPNFGCSLHAQHRI